MRRVHIVDGIHLGILIAAILLIWAVVCCAEDDAISVTAKLKVDNGYLQFDIGQQNFKADQTTAQADHGVQSVLDSATNNLTVTHVSAPHYAWMRNTDTSSSNSVTVTVTLRFQAGDIAVLPIADTNITAYTTNGAALFEYLILSE